MQNSLTFGIVGQALVESGETFKRLAEIKYSLEDSVRQNFLEPLHTLQTKDLKEVNVSSQVSLWYCHQDDRGYK
jgi:BAR domain